MVPLIKLVAIKPSAKAINFTRFGPAAKLGMQDAAEAAKADLESTFTTWNHQPTITTKERSDGYSLSVDDDVWNMLDKGTRAHRIIARKAKRLRFAGGYRAKTRPGFIGSQAGGTSGGVVFRQSVMHPGTKARSWSKLIGTKYRAKLQTFISKRIKEAM